MSPVMLRRFLGDRRRWLIGWSLGIAGYAVLNVAFYPSIRDQAQSLNEVYDSMPESVRALFGVGSGLDPMSPLGYLSSQLYALAFPLLLLIAAIGVAGSLAGEEEHGLLETTYSLPVSRRRVLVERLGAVAALLAVLCSVAFVATELSALAVDLQAGTGAVVWASVALAVLALTVAAFGMAVGALSGRRAVAVATTSGSRSPATSSPPSVTPTSACSGRCGRCRSSPTTTSRTSCGTGGRPGRCWSWPESRRSRWSSRWWGWIAGTSGTHDREVTTPAPRKRPRREIPTPVQLGVRPSRMLLRALFHHCPACGGRHLFRRWFGMADRCPTCTLRSNGSRATGSAPWA